MRWIVWCLICLLWCGIQPAFPQSYVIKFRTDVADTSYLRTTLTDYSKSLNLQQNSIRQYAVKTLASGTATRSSAFPWKKYVLLSVDEGADNKVLEEIKRNPDIEYVQQTQRYSVNSVPNDSAYSSQWNLRRIGVTRLYADGSITSSMHPVIVGVIDTGIDDEHPDLGSVIMQHQGENGIDGNGKDKRSNGIDDDGNGFVDDWRGYDFVESSASSAGDWHDRDNHPYDEHGHGTAVAGIIGAKINNGIGMAGIAPCSILPLRAFGKDGNGNDVDIASAIVYAADNGAEVINMSFGDVVRSLLLHDAIRYARSAGAVLVASSGNDGSSNPHYPSDFPEVVSVGSVNRFDQRSFFSSHSPSLSLMAPGEEILTTTVGGGYTANFSGTSAAAPHVSGVLALVRSLEKEKMNDRPQYVPMSADEMTGILQSTADDAGTIGWDDLYAAGIVNAEKAVRAVAGSVVVIHSPLQDEIVTGNEFTAIVSASTPYLQSVQVSIGRGISPTEWSTVYTVNNTILLRDTLPVLSTSSLPDDFYVLKLIAKNSKGNDIECRQRIRVLRTPPRIVSFRFRDSVIVEDRYGSLIEVRADRHTSAQLHYRPVGAHAYQQLRSNGEQQNHSFVLTADLLTPNVEYEMYCELTETSVFRRTALFSVTDSLGATVRISPASIPTTGFVKKPYSLPNGYILNDIQTAGNSPVVVLNEYDRVGDFGYLKTFRFTGLRFEALDSTSRSWIPRHFYSPVNSGSRWLLVQDRGVSSIIAVDSTGGTFASPAVWSDSSDVWASRLIDLNGDSHAEIIARSSDEYVVYKNSGGNTFDVVAHLPNMSPPLPGESRNQFGPPRAIVGDFTNSGVTEILYADHDGDLMMYRQSGIHSLSFTMAGMDTSDLFAMSDYVAAGDFNGDGRMDIAVAGHSNTDWNQDREYDFPVWTVRVFSHLPSNQPGAVTKIWEQHFTGVRTGSRNDNGITAGKLSVSDAQDALFLSLNPHLYVFRWNETTKSFVPVWTHPSHSNSVIAHDFDGDDVNELGFAVDGMVEFWSGTGGQNSAPWGLTATALSRSETRLQWTSQSAQHSIYRGTQRDSLAQRAVVTGTEWRDTLLNENTRYYYAVTSLYPAESPRSEIVSVVPHNPARIVNAVQHTPVQMKIELSFDILSKDVSAAAFVADSNNRSTSVVWVSPRTLLAAFADTIWEGNHVLRIGQLTDVYGLHGDTTEQFSFASAYRSGRDFFVRSVSLKSRNEIVVEYSEAPDMAIALDPKQYSVKTIAQSFPVASVHADSTMPAGVILRISDEINLTALALRLEISVSSDVTSLGGSALMGGKGQILSIARSIDNVGDIVVFPNPARSADRIQFVNIPENCSITVFSLTGEKVRQFRKESDSESISWNLLDERGNTLSSGVYLYRVEMNDAVGNVVKTHIGKFAVIR